MSNFPRFFKRPSHDAPYEHGFTNGWGVYERWNTKPPDAPEDLECDLVAVVEREDLADLLIEALSSERMPQYRHDCAGCIFLGRFEGHDLYFHAKEPCSLGSPTVLARYGSYGPSYTSGMPFVGQIPTLTEAYLRARLRGLIPPDHQPFPPRTPS